MMTEPLTGLTCRDMPWKWGEEQQAAFQRLKRILSKDRVVVHYDPHLNIGISCDATNVGIGTVLFHHNPDGSERPIAKASKALSPTGSTGSHLWTQEVPPLPVWEKVHLY